MTISEELRIIISADNKAEGPLGKVSATLGKVGKVALGVAAGGIAAVGAGVALVASKAIPAASDLNEAINAANVVFGENADVIHEWGQSAFESAGLSQRAFETMAAQTGAMLQNYGLDAVTAADETINLAQRAADMASIFNTDVDQALTAIQAGLRGEADPLEKFGVSLSAAAVKAKAMELGLADATGELDNQAMTTARLALLYEQTDKLAGDFVNTSDQLANASRVQAARWENFMAGVGSRFLPIVQKFQGVFMDIAEKVMPLVETALDRAMPYIEGVADAIGDFIGALTAGEGANAITGLIESLAGVFGMSEEDAARLAEGFNGLIETISNIGAAVMTWITGVALPALQQFSSWFFSVAYPAIVNFAQQALPMVIAGIQQLATWVTQVAQVVFPLLAQAVQFVTEHWNIFKPIIIAVGVAILALTSPITLIIGAIVALATAWANNWGGIQEKTKAVLNFIRGLVQTVLGAIQGFWDAHGAQVLAVVQALWDGIVAAFEWFRDFFGKIFAAFRAATEGDWKTFGQKLREAWDQVWDLIRTAVERAWEFITDAVDKGIQAIIDWFVTTDWLQVGTDVVKGIANGIDAGVRWAKDAILRLARSIWSAITGFFSSQSPSQLMAGLGEDIDLGLALGVDRLSGVVSSAMTTMAQNAVAAAEAVLLTSSQALGLDVPWAPPQVSPGATNYPLPQTGWGIAPYGNQYIWNRNDIIYATSPAATAYILEQARQAEYDKITGML